MPEKFENAALFLQLGLATKTELFENALFKPRNLKTPAFRFRVYGKHVENGAFRK